MMNPRAVSLDVLPNFQLLVGFANGESKVFDVAAYVKDIPALQQLNNPEYFLRAHLAYGTVAWSDEEDICPDTLFLDSVPTQQKAA